MITDQDKRVIRQMRWLLGIVIILVALIGANFYLAFTNPNKTIQTIIGPTGPSGSIGLKGDKGDKGDTGDQGLSGSNGGNGASGVNGSNGVNGINGADGKDGLNGQDGANGTNGANGNDGRTPEMGCVDGNISWKYTDESSWKSLNAACNQLVSQVNE